MAEAEIPAFGMAHSHVFLGENHDKAERRTQRKQDKPEPGSQHEQDELRAAAEAQAALFHVGHDESSSQDSTPSADEPVK